MELVFSEDIKQLLGKNNNDEYEFIKSPHAIHTLYRLGESRLAEKLKAHQWTNLDKDRKLIDEVLYELGINIGYNLTFEEAKASKLEFNCRADFEKEGYIRIINNGNREFKLKQENIICSSHIRILDIETKDNTIILKYIINIIKGTVDYDLEESITILSNLNTHVYRVFLKCKTYLEFDNTYKFKNIYEFYKLYISDYNGAIDCYTSDKFNNWLEDNEFTKEQFLYKTFESYDPKISIQSFFQALHFEEKPIISAKLEEDKITIQNKGKGFLHAKIEVSPGVELNKYNWNQNDESIQIIKFDRGRINIISNGGIETLEIYEETKSSKINIEIINIQASLNFFKHRIAVKHKTDCHRVFLDNKYIKYKKKKKKVILKKNISLLEYIKRKIKKIKTVTNINLICSDRVIKYKITIG